ncbi:DUF262 domain-containing protein [Leisingera aquaemixtae]|uniref:DUF262 domain-containing protein n=1 Tax=Leisingera aquaemixtae TaxID=1396826 RepID=UPI0021A2D394|nr:DUF262 domain-containing protein [Leisingera aquaemixtae]UWQ35780.1 DUF262 domain-containing protein [Leisingera aquaemixtae]
MPDPMSSISAPQIIPIYDLIDRVASGELRIPRFQRPYVWSPEDMIELFDSIFNGYPIGSLLIWETSLQDVSSLESLGPIELPTDVRTTTSYVVDGHQRLATLVGVLSLPVDYPSETMSEWRWWIGYDLENEEFVHFKRRPAGSSSSVVPLRRVIQTVDFARLTRDLATNLPEDKLDTYLERADRLNRKLRDYQVPATVMKSASLDDAVNIFARVNQRGRDMTADQMVSALSFRDRSEGAFNLADSIDTTLQELSAFGFGGTERKTVLQSVLFAAGLNFTRPAYEKLVNRNSHQSLRPAADNARAALVSSARFLNEKIGLKSDRLLPYASQFSMLSFFMLSLDSNSGSAAAENAGQLIKWFWTTSFNGWFAGANTTDLRKAAERMKFLAEGSIDNDSFTEFFADRPIRSLPKAFDRRSARIRASLAVQLLSQHPIDPRSGETLDGFEILRDPETRDIPYFFYGVPSPLGSHPANRVILPSDCGRNVRDLFLNEASNEALLKSHFVSEKALAALASDDANNFLSAREEEIKAIERTFLESVGLRALLSGNEGKVQSDSDGAVNDVMS